MSLFTSLLTGWQSILARIAMGALIIGALILFGWLKGHESAMAQFNAYRQSLATQAAVQVAHNADLVKQQRATSARIEGNYETELANIRSRTNADWLRVNPGADNLPGLPAASGISTGMPAERVPAPSKVLRDCSETTLDYVTLYKAWAQYCTVSGCH